MLVIIMAWRNLVRHWRRTLVTTLAMAFAGFIMILFSAVIEGMMAASERNVVATDMGEMQIHAHGYRDDPDIYNRIDNFPSLTRALGNIDVMASGRLYAFGLMAAGKSSAGVQLRGVDPHAEAQVTDIHEKLKTGRWLNSSRPGDVVIGRKLARLLNVSPGDELVFIGQAADGSMANDLFRVGGILKSIGSSIDQAAVFLTIDSYRELMSVPDGVHEIALRRLEPNTSIAERQQQVAQLLDDGVQVLHWRELQPMLANLLDLAAGQQTIMISITYIAVAMVVLNAMLMSVFERIHEFGVMRAVGVSPWQLIMLVLTETLWQVLLAATLALLSGYGLTRWLQQRGLDLSGLSEGSSMAGVAIDPVIYPVASNTALFVPLVLLFLLALLAVIYPAGKAALIQPVNALRQR